MRPRRLNLRRITSALLNPPADGLQECAPGRTGWANSVKSDGDQAADLVAAGDDGGVAPEAFEVVVGPLLLEEDVDDKVDEVEEDPPRLAFSFAAQGPGVFGAAGALDLFGDGADLAVAIARADDEVVRDDQWLRDVEDEHVAGLLGGCRRGGREGEVEAGRQGRAPGVGTVGHLYGSEPAGGVHPADLTGPPGRGAAAAAGRAGAGVPGRPGCGTGRASGCSGRPRRGPGTGWGRPGPRGPGSRWRRWPGPGSPCGGPGRR